MTNLALLHPNPSFGARWLHAHHKSENWRNFSSPATNSEMPESNSSSKSTASTSSKGKRILSREKSRKSQEERNNNKSPEVNPGNIIKQERLPSVRIVPTSQTDIGSPNHSTIPSPSASPKSPSASRNNRTPSSVAGTPPHPSFTPPTSITPACFSPASMGGLGAMAGLPNPLGSMGIFNGTQNLPDGMRNMGNAMPRNCSDLMRSMAAKYNNNSSASLQFYNNPTLNGFPRPPLPSAAGFSNAAFIPGLPNESSTSPVQTPRDPSNSKQSETPQLKRPTTSGHTPAIPPHLLSPGAFPGLPSNPLMDLSSTQVLINMVRNASNIHQSHLQKTHNDLHSQHQFQKQLLYQQQLQQQQQQQQVAHQQHQLQEHEQNSHKQLQNSQFNKLDDERTNVKPVDHTVGSNNINDTSNHRTGVKRPAEAASPLDLSATVPNKHLRAATETDINVEDDDVSVPHVSPDTPNSPPIRMKTEICSSPVQQKLRFDDKEDTTSWTVDDVFDFVRSIDICTEYAENFRDQRIDGACLLLLSESHLTDSLKMKLGPALKLRSFLANRSHHRNQHHHNHYQPLSPPCRSCNHCTSYNNNNNNNSNISNNNINGDTMCKKLSYSDSMSTDLSSPRLCMVSPIHTTKSLSPPHQIENGSPVTLENRLVVATAAVPMSPQ